MNGKRLIPRIIKGSMFATFVDDGSMNQSSNSITLNPKDLLELKQTDWITSGQPTLYVTGVKDHSILTIPGWLPAQKVLLAPKKPTSQNGKICEVCGGTYIHEDKCTNKQLLLEGSLTRPSPSLGA